MNYIKFLPLLALVSCGNSIDKTQSSADTTDSSVVENVDSLKSGEDECEFGESYVEDPNDECFKVPHQDIMKLSEILKDRAIEVSDTSIRFKMDDGLIGYIFRDGGCSSDSQWQRMKFRISGFQGSDWRKFEYLKKLYTEQTKKLPWIDDHDVLNYFEKAEFEYTPDPDCWEAHGYMTDEDDPETGEKFFYDIGDLYITLGDDYTEMIFDWHG